MSETKVISTGTDSGVGFAVPPDTKDTGLVANEPDKTALPIEAVEDYPTIKIGDQVYHSALNLSGSVESIIQDESAGEQPVYNVRLIQGGKFYGYVTCLADELEIRRTSGIKSESSPPPSQKAEQNKPKEVIAIEPHKETLEPGKLNKAFNAAMLLSRAATAERYGEAHDEIAGHLFRLLAGWSETALLTEQQLNIVRDWSGINSELREQWGLGNMAQVDSLAQRGYQLGKELVGSFGNNTPQVKSEFNAVLAAANKIKSTVESVQRAAANLSLTPAHESVPELKVAITVAQQAAKTSDPDSGAVRNLKLIGALCNRAVNLIERNNAALLNTRQPTASKKETNALYNTLAQASFLCSLTIGGRVDGAGIKTLVFQTGISSRDARKLYLFTRAGQSRGHK